jgi:transposase
MRKVRDVLRLKHTLGMSFRQISEATGIGKTVVGEYVRRAGVIGITWPVPEGIDDPELERRLFPVAGDGTAAPRPAIDWRQVHEEMKRRSVTLVLLWQEYRAEQADGYGYSRFCDLYGEWRKTISATMRQTHPAGERLFVDYAGDTVPVFDQMTNAERPAHIFVAALGASNYTYAEATLTQRSVDFIQSHTRAVEYFGGVSAVGVPDQLRTGVTDPCRYEPTIQRTYADWARHYGTAIVPARPAKPRDKAKVEVAVQVAERWILARLRNEPFFTLAALNARIAELLSDLNDRPMKGYGGASRRALFERFDRPALQPLPRDRYVHADWRHARVNIDYHVEVDRHYYSVPHALIHAAVEICLTATTVDVLNNRLSGSVVD